MFQSTLPRGERRSLSIRSIRVQKFQSTLPRGERQTRRKPIRQQGGFNPRSHEGSDTANVETTSIKNVSIHAPTRGATPFGNYYKSGKFIVSIHAPTRGATLCQQCRMPGTLSFQSTLPRGERHKAKAHSPSDCCFNPRSHEGSDRSKRC